MHVVIRLESSIKGTVFRRGFFSWAVVLQWALLIQMSGTRLTVCAFIKTARKTGEEVWLALAVIRLFEAKRFSGLALAVSVER